MSEHSGRPFSGSPLEQLGQSILDLLSKSISQVNIAASVSPATIMNHRVATCVSLHVVATFFRVNGHPNYQNAFCTVLVCLTCIILPAVRPIPNLLFKTPKSLS